MTGKLPAGSSTGAHRNGVSMGNMTQSRVTLDDGRLPQNNFMENQSNLLYQTNTNKQPSVQNYLLNQNQQVKSTSNMKKSGKLNRSLSRGNH